MYRTLTVVISAASFDWAIPAKSSVATDAISKNIKIRLPILASLLVPDQEMSRPTYWKKLTLRNQRKVVAFDVQVASAEVILPLEIIGGSET